MSTIQIVSPSFSDGGAERILSYLVNHSNAFEGISLTGRIDYIRPDRTHAVKLKRPSSRIRLVRILQTVGFCFKMIDPSKRIMASSYEIFLICYYVTILRRKHKIIFRPSIGYDFIREELRSRFGVLAFPVLALLERAVANSLLLFQTSAIRESFARAGLNPRSVTAPNPVDYQEGGIPQFRRERGMPMQLVFVGRLTAIKGFDRFVRCAMSVPRGQHEARWHVYGVGELGVRLDTAPLAEIEMHGWVPRSEFVSKNPVLVVPSRLEGLPNIVFEAVFAGWPVVVSKEARQSLVDDPLVHSYVEEFDFDSDPAGLLPFAAAVLERHKYEDALDAIVNLRQANDVGGYIEKIQLLTTDRELEVQ